MIKIFLTQDEIKEKYKKKMENLKILHERGFKEEAITLCCLYIESLTKIFEINKKGGDSHKKFCEALINYSKNGIFKKVKLLRMLSKMREEKERDNIREKILKRLEELGYKIAHSGREVFVDYKNGGSDYPELVFDDKDSIEK